MLATHILGLGIKYDISCSRSCSAASVKLCFKANDIIRRRLVTMEMLAL